MMVFESIGKRIVKAYLLFALAFSIFFMTVTVAIVEGIEVCMVERRLDEVAAWASPRHAGGLPVEVPTGISFYHGAGIPGALSGLPPGINEVAADGIGLHVLSARDSGGSYVVVDHESDHVGVERLVYSLLLLSLLGFLGMSVGLGRVVARRFVDPKVALSKAVLERKEGWAHLHSGNEMGILARAFAAHTEELTVFLERERGFTGDVSHELRTALTVISGAAELIELDPHATASSRAASGARAGIHRIRIVRSRVDGAGCGATQPATGGQQTGAAEIFWWKRFFCARRAAAVCIRCRQPASQCLPVHRSGRDQRVAGRSQCSRAR